LSEPARGRYPRTALVLTASDRSAAGTREDTSGAGVAERLEQLGFAVERLVVGDEREAIAAALRTAAERHPLIVTTGGTGLTPRDVTPQATVDVVDYEVPGLAETMRADGRLKTPYAALSRAVVGVRGRTLIVNVPGSPKGALESIEAIVPVLEHALETLAGPFDHVRGEADDIAETGDAPGDSTEDQHQFGRDEAFIEPEDAD
jgi:molybdopterin adenylyltransferase